MFLPFKLFCYENSISWEESVRVAVPSWSPQLFLTLGQGLGVDQEYLSWKRRVEHEVNWWYVLMCKGDLQLGFKPSPGYPLSPALHPQAGGSSEPCDLSTNPQLWTKAALPQMQQVSSFGIFICNEELLSLLVL